MDTAVSYRDVNRRLPIWGIGKCMNCVSPTSRNRILVHRARCVQRRLQRICRALNARAGAREEKTGGFPYRAHFPARYPRTPYAAQAGNKSRRTAASRGAASRASSRVLSQTLKKQLDIGEGTHVELFLRDGFIESTRSVSRSSATATSAVPLCHARLNILEHLPSTMKWTRNRNELLALRRDAAWDEMGINLN